MQEVGFDVLWKGVRATQQDLRGLFFCLPAQHKLPHVQCCAEALAGYVYYLQTVAFEGKPSRWSSLTLEERLGYQIQNSCGLLRAHPQWCERLEDWGLSIFLEPES